MSLDYIKKEVAKIIVDLFPVRVTRLIRSYSTKTHPQGKEVGTLLVHHSDDENDEWSAFASSN